ncbi:calcium-binding mitochondrial carrier protein Aralar1-like [Mercenaria mercenaria]|uniref:calcium-binding mitochondrial carrier protein Aralar1-like n=1 Tax=Mercenaria mercenaria TaxID=6596 RepID=UPI00234FB326|nr:calcium-binding mitochondrial carrier protein Aralar1-like [Mercenaria mercenaria]
MTRKMAASIREKYLARFSAKWPFATKVECEAHKEEGLMRADSEHLRTIFNKYASVTEGDEKFMTYPDFIQRFLQLLDTKDYNEYTLQLFGSSIDTSRDGKISFTEFQAFEHLLSLPDAMYRLSFQIYDRNGSGFLSFKEFEDIVKHTTLHKTIPFNFDCDFIQLHFGVDKSRRISYAEFTQLIHDFNEEHALQAFRKFDHDNNGYINAKDFEEIMISLKSYLLTPFVQENLVSIFEVRYFPEKWSDSYVIPLHKKGSINTVDNRGITLLSCLGKLFTRIFNNRLKSWAEYYNVYVEAQAGFRPNMSTIDNVFVLNGLINHVLNQGKQLFKVFIDYTKAFDYVVKDNL